LLIYKLLGFGVVVVVVVLELLVEVLVDVDVLVDVLLELVVVVVGATVVDVVVVVLLLEVLVLVELLLLVVVVVIQQSVSEGVAVPGSPAISIGKFLEQTSIGNPANTSCSVIVPVAQSLYSKVVSSTPSQVKV
jgi:hypothetical protein